MDFDLRCEISGDPNEANILTFGIAVGFLLASGVCISPKDMALCQRCWIDFIADFKASDEPELSIMEYCNYLKQRAFELIRNVETVQ